MTLEQFLGKIGKTESNIIEYRGDESIKAVEQNGDALRYVSKLVFSAKAKIELTISDIETKFGCSVVIVSKKDE